MVDSNKINKFYDKNSKDKYLTIEESLIENEMPSVFFNGLSAHPKFKSEFPHLYRLSETEQDLTHHPEGNVWNHTMMVIDEGAKIKNSSTSPKLFMLALLCHDFGKPETTSIVDGKIRSFGHEDAGLLPSEEFLSNFSLLDTERRYVLEMVKYHMRPLQLNSRKSAKKLMRETLFISDLLLITEADQLGRDISRDKINSVVKDIQTLRDLIESVSAQIKADTIRAEAEKDKPKPLVNNGDLINIFGLNPRSDKELMNNITLECGKMQNELGYDRSQLLAMIPELIKRYTQ